MSVEVVGVDLHRKRFPAVEQFHQQRELLEPAGAPEDRFLVDREQFGERTPGEGAFGDAAWVVRMAADFPRLAIYLVRLRQAFAEALAEGATAPDLGA